MGDVYYRFFPGDYMRDTSDLSMAEDGAYRRLLDHYYSEEELPSEKERLYRICRASSDEEKKAVEYVMERFFKNEGGRLLNKRAERELEERRKYLAEQKRKSVLGHRARYGDKMPTGMPTGRPAGTLGACPDDAQPSPSPSLSSSPTNKDQKHSRSAARKREIVYPEEFKTFWEIYPRRVAKMAALKSWKRKTAEYPPQHIISAAEEYAEYCDKNRTEEKYILYPTTFLNQDRWKEFCFKENTRGDYGQRNQPNHGADIGTGKGNTLRAKYAGIGTTVVVGGEESQG